MIGKTFAHYEILEMLGEGGMGQVHRAVDTRLHREVAIKILPETLGRDPERLARFGREAQMLASMNHPNIASIYGLETDGDVQGLVLELVEGPTLADRLRAGPVPLDEVLAIARQIADALEAAHAKGIVHRDLKPANVKITPEGKVKVLDFGLAKAWEADPAATDLSLSPTITMAATQAGVILGTAAYMSPEQARGQAVGPQADIWAFGCVLYETLTGEMAFSGGTVTDILASIVKLDPDWSLVPASTPRPLLRLLRRCLEKDAHRRLHSIADARLEIDAAAAGEERVADAPPAVLPPTARRSRWILLLGVFALAMLALGAFLGRTVLAPDGPPTAPPLHLTIDGIDLRPRSLFDLSPDGSQLVYGSVAPDGTALQLYLRSLDQPESHPIPGTVGGTNPFFSPDGEWIGFFQDRQMKKIALSGSVAQSLCDAQGNFATGAWGEDGTIVFAASVGQTSRESILLRVPATGGRPEALTSLDGRSKEQVHYDPCFLPDGEHVLFTTLEDGRKRIALLSLATRDVRVLIDNAGRPRYASMGYLVYYDTESDVIAAVPFDTKALAITGAPVVLTEDPRQLGDAVAGFAVSQSGVFVYAPLQGSFSGENTVVWVDRSGKATPALAEARSWAQPRISPQGDRILLRETAVDCMLWSYDLERGTLTRITFDGDNHDPLWTPDGARVTFRSERTTAPSPYWKNADGTGSAEQLVAADNTMSPSSWSSDGRLLSIVENDPLTGNDILIFEPKTGKTRPFLATDFDEDHPVFSPDGRWIAYDSNESGRTEVFVRPFPGPGAKLQISARGGIGPIWSHDGREIFFASGSTMMAVEVKTEPTFHASPARELFEGNYLWERPRNYDVSPDGSRFVLLAPKGDLSNDDELRIVVNWFAELRRLVPHG
jgi:Tol biopolymer transport system component/tRNA A-37 threonylcarbamoyl transferase component Bud32